jgi:hypothetical protein
MHAVLFFCRVCHSASLPGTAELSSGNPMYAVRLVISIYALLLVCGLMHDMHCTLVIITNGL